MRRKHDFVVRIRVACNVAQKTYTDAKKGKARVSNEESEGEDNRFHTQQDRSSKKTDGSWLEISGYFENQKADLVRSLKIPFNSVESRSSFLLAYSIRFKNLQA